MTREEIERQVLDLSETERLQVAETIWASLRNPDSLPLPDWQRDLLDERLANSEGEEGRDWEDVRAEIWPDIR
jgi:putative addiction module component (TIGR02574 family)